MLSLIMVDRDLTVRLAVLGLFFLAAACGGKQTTSNDGDTGATASVADAGSATEQAPVHAKYCPTLCSRLSDCAMEDARNNMTPEEIEKERLEEKMGQHTKECEEECRGLDISERQVAVVRACVETEHDSCEAYVNCLEEAAKRDRPADAPAEAPAEDPATESAK